MSIRALTALLVPACAVLACHDAPDTETPFPTVLPSDLAEHVARATLLGGSRSDPIRDVAFDAHGNVYLAGGTDSPDHPLVPHEKAKGSMDVLVAKLDSRGEPLWARRLGGPGHDRAYAVEPDVDGAVWIAGRAGPGFPVTEGAFQTRFMGGRESREYGPQDGFVCRLSHDGAIDFCSYFGTSDPRPVRDLAVGPSGEVFIVSGTASGSYPEAVERTFRNRRHGGDDAVVARIAPDGSRVLWGVFLGGEDRESHENTVRVDRRGNPYVLFTTRSEGLATAGAWGQSLGGDEDVFVARLSPADGRVIWGRYIGGAGNESTETHEMAVDPRGHAVVAVPTKSPMVVTSEHAVRRRPAGGDNDIYVVRLSPDGELVAATLFGGSGADRPEGVASDACGNVYLTGTSTSPDFPSSAAAPPGAPFGGRDAFLLVLSPTLDAVRHAGLLGGDRRDFGRSAAVTAAGDRVVLGITTDSGQWPATRPLQSGYGGGHDDAVLVLVELPAACLEEPPC